MRAKILLLNNNDEWQYHYFPTKAKARAYKKFHGLFSDMEVESHTPMSERKKRKRRKKR